MRQLGFGIHLISRGEGDPATTPFPSHRVMLADGVRAERLGFDAVWLPDHFYFDKPAGLETYPEAFTLMTAIAMQTERVMIGTNVVAATFRHPALLAKMAGAIQELSEGRLLLGIGAANQVKENTAFGFNFERRIGAFKEYLPILSRLLAGETVTFEGRYFTLREASLRTFVPQVPLWVAAGGEQMIDLAARYGAGWNAAGGVARNPAAFKEKYAMLAKACQAAGRNVDEIDVTVMFSVAVAPDEAAAKAMTEELAVSTNQPPDLLAQRMTIGTPDQVAAHVRTLTELGVNHVIFMQSETSRFPEYWDGVELLVREVIPRIRA